MMIIKNSEQMLYLLDMTLHQWDRITTNEYIERVPGGWIYHHTKGEPNTAEFIIKKSTFVPEPLHHIEIDMNELLEKLNLIIESLNHRKQ